MSEEANYDEAKLPAYVLPDPLVMLDGNPVRTADEWRQKRRPELLQLFETHQFGHAPPRPAAMRFELFDSNAQALGGIAQRKQIAIYLGEASQSLRVDMLVYLPAKRSGPVPLFLGLNFTGNYTIADEPEIRMTESWFRNDEKSGITANRANPERRGREKELWPLAEILARGYGFATIYYGDIDPDYDDQFHNGVHSLYPDAPNGTARAGDAWGSISAWAWGLSRAMDYLETDPDVDHRRIAVYGHSRLGKTSLWAGASDERFALIISNQSGCGGAALHRRIFGETVGRINRSFPHWFCSDFHQYNENEAKIPVDSHELIALLAPRPVLICSAEEDRWADPRGEFLGAYHASPVYSLLGHTGIAAADMPGMNQLTGDRVAYHIRPGAHDMNAGDWRVFLEFSDRHLK